MNLCSGNEMLRKARRSQPVNLVFSPAAGLFDGRSDQLINPRIVECRALLSQAPDNPADIPTKPLVAVRAPLFAAQYRFISTGRQPAWAPLAAVPDKRGDERPAAWAGN